MAKAKNKDSIVQLDMEAITEQKYVPVASIEHKDIYTEQDSEVSKTMKFINCLKDKKIIVRHVPKIGGMITNPKHILYGGMAEEAIRYLTVPMVKGSNNYVKVLTDSERIFLEHIMGLKDNSLGVYNKIDNYWENYQIALKKQDTILDLNYPEDYIKYKILLHNDSLVAANLQALDTKPKATYQFVLISPEEEVHRAKDTMESTMECYKIFTSMSTNAEKLRAILELVESRSISKNTKIEFLQTRVNNIIQKKPALFLTIAKDPRLDTKILIGKCVDKKLINRVNSYYYLASDNSVLCETNQQPTLDMAATYLNLPKNQELKVSLETLLKIK